MVSRYLEKQGMNILFHSDVVHIHSNGFHLKGVTLTGG